MKNIFRLLIVAAVCLAPLAVPAESEAGPLRRVGSVAKRVVGRVAKVRPFRAIRGAFRGGCSNGSCR